MTQDTLLGFPAHTLPYRHGEYTALSTVSFYFVGLMFCRTAAAGKYGFQPQGGGVMRCVRQAKSALYRLSVERPRIAVGDFYIYELPDEVLVALQAHQPVALGAGREREALVIALTGWRGRAFPPPLCRDGGSR